MARLALGKNPNLLAQLGTSVVEKGVLLAHSRQDEIVPFRHGERLFAAVKGPKAFLELAGGHNDGFLFTREASREALGRFLAQHLPAGAMSPVPR